MSVKCYFCRRKVVGMIIMRNPNSSSSYEMFLCKKHLSEELAREKSMLSGRTSDYVTRKNFWEWIESNE